MRYFILTSGSGTAAIAVLVKAPANTSSHEAITMANEQENTNDFRVNYSFDSPSAFCEYLDPDEEPHPDVTVFFDGHP